MSDKKNLQDVFLNNIRKQKSHITLFLVNGVKLQGSIVSFDSFSVLLKRDTQQQLIYKHAISTIVPATPVSLFESEGEETENDSEAL